MDGDESDAAPRKKGEGFSIARSKEYTISCRRSKMLPPLQQTRAAAQKLMSEQC